MVCVMAGVYTEKIRRKEEKANQQINISRVLVIVLQDDETRVRGS